MEMYVFAIPRAAEMRELNYGIDNSSCRGWQFRCICRGFTRPVFSAARVAAALDWDKSSQSGSIRSAPQRT